MTDKLSPQRRLFVLEFIKDQNATQAAIRAGYSARSARNQSARLMANDDIKAEIAEALQARCERTEIDADWVLKKLAMIVDADPVEILNDDLSLKPMSEWPEHWRKILSSFDVREEFVFTADGKAPDGWLKKIKWPDKLKALELIGKHVDVAAFAEQHKVDHNINRMDTIMEEIYGKKRSAAAVPTSTTLQ